MRTSVGTGFRRVTVVAPDSRVDVALPETIAVSDIYPEILRLTRQTQPADAPTGYYLFRTDGSALDSSRSLADQRVVDGEMLHLRPFAQSLPPAVYDDVSDAVASAVARDRRLWNDGMLRGVGLVGVGVLLALLGAVLWCADPVRHDMHSLPGVIAATAGLLVAAFAGVRARVYRDQPSAIALGLGALPVVWAAGSGIVGPDSGQGAGRLQFLLGCIAALVASVALVALSPQGDAPFLAATFVAAGKHPCGLPHHRHRGLRRPGRRRLRTGGDRADGLSARPLHPAGQAARRLCHAPQPGRRGGRRRCRWRAPRRRRPPRPRGDGGHRRPGPSRP